MSTWRCACCVAGGQSVCPTTSWPCPLPGTGGSCKLFTGVEVASCPSCSQRPALVVAAIRWPHAEVLTVLDPRPLLDEAAVVAARFGGTGLIVAETLAAGLAHGRQLWFGTSVNVGRLLARAAGDLGVTLHVIAP